MSTDPWGRPLGTAPGEAYGPRPIEPMRAPRPWRRWVGEGLVVVVASAMVWFVLIYVLFV